MSGLHRNLAALAALLIVFSTEKVQGIEPADAQKLALNAMPGFSILKADQKQQAWLRVGLTGFHLPREGTRAPINVAIVLDRSGSMQGEKIQRAREAAIGALDLLGADDIVSIIAYDSDVNVLVPATKLTDKEHVAGIIRAIQPGGNTALFGGVSKGAAEVRKFIDDKHVNRIILLSDGLANVGPSSPGELGDLGASMKKENISVSTLGLGLGYNEDLMVQLAGKSGGNHQFIEDASELAGIFRREFDDVLSVVAQGVDVTVEIPEGIRPVRVLGNAADINGQSVVTRLSQVYSDQQKHVVIEVEIPADLAHVAVDSAGAEITKPSLLASVSVSYMNMVTTSIERLTGEVSVSFSSSDEKVNASVNKGVMADVVALVASEQNKLATDLLDRGDIMGCRKSLEANALFLDLNAEKFESETLNELARENRDQVQRLQGVTSNSAPAAQSARKSMRGYQYESDSQQSKTAKP
ncbi:MAG: VWA domain-containing protein [Planctomycetaceae bacterium]|nr:VWA domain-containing protein [Planctomycetaceae bacterium]